MKILITGIGGFAGSHLADLLIKNVSRCLTSLVKRGVIRRLNDTYQIIDPFFEYYLALEFLPILLLSQGKIA